MSLKEKWRQAVDAKDSLLCVGLDPTEPGQSPSPFLKAGESKLEYCLRLLEAVAPYAAAVKPNRQYVKDLSRAELRAFNDRAHALGLISLDDSKVADIGDTNDAAFFHAKQEAFDAVTYAPFPGNVADSVARAHRWDVGIIPLVLMSNPEYRAMKQALVDGVPLYRHVASQCAAAGADGIVIGAPSEKNHITADEVNEVRRIVGDTLALIPGFGAQGGDFEPVYQAFGDLCIVNVGRAIMRADEPGRAARHFRDLIQKARHI